jgi:hypothetical protein
MYLTEEQRSKLADLARSEGVSEAEVVRRILDRALGVPDVLEERLTAVDETAGLLADAPDWPEWLARVRRGGAHKRLKELGL